MDKSTAAAREAWNALDEELAEYLSGIPKEQKPHALVLIAEFGFKRGYEAGRRNGVREFIEKVHKRGDWHVREVVAEVQREMFGEEGE